MAENNQVKVEISLEEKAALKALTQLTREVQKTEDSFKSMGDQGDKSLTVVGEVGKGVSDGFGSLVKGVTIANLASSAIIGTANAVKSFVIDSVNAAIEAEQSNVRLAQSLRAVGAYSEENMALFQNYSTEMARKTKYSDDDIITNIALAKSMGATNTQAMNLVMAAAELSATFGGSLESRVQQLGKTLTGTGGKLDTLIPGFKALTEEQLKSGEAIDFINKKFSGAAANEIDTYAGKLAQLKKSYGELQEATGALVVESGVSRFFESLGGWVDFYTQKIADSRIEEARQQEGFQETSASLDQLKRRYQELYEEANEAKLIVNDPDWFDILLGRTSAAEANLKRLNSEMAATQALITQATPAVQANIDNAPQGNVPKAQDGMSEEDKKRVASREEAYNLMMKAQVDFAAYEAEQDLMKREVTAQNYQAELDQLIGIEQAKIDAQFAMEETRAAALTDAKTKEYTIQKLAADKELAIERAKVDAKKKIDQQMVALESQKQAAIAAASIAGLQLLATVAKDGSKEQFLISKAAAIATAAVAAHTAYLQALAFPPGPPATIPTANWVAAQGAINIAAIAASAIKGFEHGGIIPGISNTGDKVPAYVNSGEMIINKAQQTELFNIANGGGRGGSSDQIERLIEAINNQTIQFVVDGRVLATSVRKEVQSGFRLY